MRLSFFLAMLALLAIVASPRLGSAQQVVDCKTQPSNPACEKHRQQPGTPTECRDPRWYNIHQTRPGSVTLNIYAVQNNGQIVQVNAANPQHSETKQEYDRFCISGHWLDKGYLFEWCTDDAGRVIRREAMIAYANSSHVIELVRSDGNEPSRDAAFSRALNR